VLSYTIEPEVPSVISTVRPAPSAVAPVPPLATVTFLSSTSSVVVLATTLSPLTVKSPAITTLPSASTVNSVPFVPPATVLPVRSPVNVPFTPETFPVATTSVVTARAFTV